MILDLKHHEMEKIEYRGFEITQIWVDSSHWSKSEIEISFGTDDMIYKAHFIHYVPELHDKLFEGGVTLAEKWAVLKQDIESIIDKNYDAYMSPPEKEKTYFLLRVDDWTNFHNITRLEYLKMVRNGIYVNFEKTDIQPESFRVARDVYVKFYGRSFFDGDWRTNKVVQILEEQLDENNDVVYCRFLTLSGSVYELMSTAEQERRSHQKDTEIKNARRYSELN